MKDVLNNCVTINVHLHGYSSLSAYSQPVLLVVYITKDKKTNCQKIVLTSMIQQTINFDYRVVLILEQCCSDT